MSNSFSPVSSGSVLSLVACQMPTSGPEELALTESALEASPNRKGIADTVHTSGVIESPELQSRPAAADLAAQDNGRASHDL